MEGVDTTIVLENFLYVCELYSFSPLKKLISVMWVGGLNFWLLDRGYMTYVKLGYTFVGSFSWFYYLVSVNVAG